MAERFTLPPLITQSSWLTMPQALWVGRGVLIVDDGSVAPMWTNREALAVTMALRTLADGRQRLVHDWDPGRSSLVFPLWYQFAAAAYGWQPSTDELDTSAAQADALYDADTASMLREEVERVVKRLDDAKSPDPRIEIVDAFDDPAVQREVQTALTGDGAKATFKIPLPACKDPKTGKPARPVRDATGKWSCPGGAVMIDDPITALLKSLGKVAAPLAIIAIAYAVYNEGRRGRRRRR